MRGRGLVLSVSLLVLLAVTASTALAGDVEVSIPAAPVNASVKVVTGVVVTRYPTFSTPEFVEPGGWLVVKLVDGVNVSRVVLDDGYGHRISYNVAPGASVLRLRIPGNAARGLYDLYLEAGGTIYVVPHAVYIGEPGEFRDVYIVHVTDRHFGVINSNGRAAANYDLAADFIALGLPGNTIVIDTGDIADTARVVEYRDSLWTDTLLNKPMISIPGNHDHVGGSSNYVTYRGPWNFTLSIYGLYRVVGIDSGGDGYVLPDQARWAASVLTGTPERVKIVLFHHPHFTHMFGDVPFNFTLASWEELLKLLLSKKPHTSYMYIYKSWTQNMEGLRELVKGIFEANASRVLVLSGHVHLDSYAEVHRASDGATINYIVTTATGGSVRPGDYHGFRVIHVTSDGRSVEILGDGVFYTRHASFNLEKVHAGIVVSGKASGAYLYIEPGTRIPSVMERVVLAVPVPEDMEGKQLRLHLEGLDGYRLRCTAAGCVLYAYSEKPPEPGKVYKAVLYSVADREPPRIRVVTISPRNPVAGRPVTVMLRVADDAWGVQEVHAYALYQGGRVNLTTSMSGSTVIFSIPPLRGAKNVTVVVEAVDMAGRKAEKRIVVEYRQPSTTKTTATTISTVIATTVSTVSTPSTQQAAETTTTTAAGATVTSSVAGATSTAGTTTKTTTPPTTTTGVASSTAPTPTSSPSTQESGGAQETGAGGASGGALVVAVIVAAAVAYLALMARRRG